MLLTLKTPMEILLRETSLLLYHNTKDPPQPLGTLERNMMSLMEQHTHYPLSSGCQSIHGGRDTNSQFRNQDPTQPVLTLERNMISLM